MDKNKLKVLHDIGYKIAPSCALCKHGEFRTLKDDFGSCLAKTYEHLKHTGDPRQLSVHRGGVCRDFEEDAAKHAKLGTFQEFFDILVPFWDAEDDGGTVFAGPTHPLWKSFDDDDWGGATCSQWILACKDKEVFLRPPKDILAGGDADLLARVRKSISNYAKSVEVLG